jgi:hypothetical protein
MIFKKLLKSIKYQLKLLPYRPYLYWSRLWVRKDEFHPTLSLDGRLLNIMNKKDRLKYIDDLIKRRQIAHERDLK